MQDTPNSRRLNSSLSRRTFLKTGVAAAASLSYGTFFLRDARAESPNERLQLALIGVGGRGGPCRSLVGGRAEWVGLCDVDDRPDETREKTYGLLPEVPKFTDYREMLAELGDKVDGVVIATPDHSHFHAGMLAMSLGKHVYMEKPMSHLVWEARELTRKAAETGVATQMGNTGHSNDSTAMVRDYVQSGAIGPVRRVIVRNNRVRAVETPPQTAPVPPELDWQLWLNRAPYHEFAPVYAPNDWRLFHYFGTGLLGDWGAHDLDAAFYALNLTAPVRVENNPTADWPVSESWPMGNHIIWDFPARGDMPPVRMEYLLGRARLPEDLDLPDDIKKNMKTALLIGDEGYITYSSYGADCRVLPLEKMRALGRPPQMGPEGTSHMGSWTNACKGVEGANPLASFDYSGPLTETMLLGNVALRAGRPIEWDSESFTVKNDPEAQALVEGPEAREGWQVKPV
jgi:hypothetical protein